MTASLALVTHGYIKGLPAVHPGEWLGSAASLALAAHGRLSQSPLLIGCRFTSRITNRCQQIMNLS